MKSKDFFFLFYYSQIMKTIFIFILIIISPLIYAKNFSYSNLVKINDVYFIKKSKVPFSGKVVGAIEGKFKNGKKHGEFLKYYQDGKLLSKINYFENKNV